MSQYSIEADQNTNKSIDQAALVGKYFLDKFNLELFTEKQPPANKKEELANKYFTKVMEVFGVFDRLCRYEKYFKDFIPPKESGISESEALEYHLRSYIQEFYILRERICKTVDSLKADLIHYDIANPDDVVMALDHLKKNVDSNFKKINDELRREHVHERSVSDPDLTIGKLFSSILSGEILLPESMSLDMDKLREHSERMLAERREHYIQQAVHNSVGIKGFKQFFAARFGHIFASLNGHSDILFNMKAGFQDEDDRDGSADVVN